MESAKVTVETSTEPAPIVHHEPIGRFHFWKTLASIYLSRKFVMTMTLFWMIYGVYWAAVKCLFSFENADQIHAFTTIFQTTMGTLGAIALGYLGFSRSGGAGLSTYFPSSQISSAPRAPSRNTKDLD